MQTEIEVPHFGGIESLVILKELPNNMLLCKSRDSRAHWVVDAFGAPNYFATVFVGKLAHLEKAIKVCTKEKEILDTINSMFPTAIMDIEKHEIVLGDREFIILHASSDMPYNIVCKCGEEILEYDSMEEIMLHPIVRKFMQLNCKVAIRENY